jgi:predicted AAA+ superfamily ATPase
MEQLFHYSKSLIAQVDVSFKRYAYANINWKNRLIGLTGPRGVGKTTLVLQYIKTELDPQKSLYVTAEDFYFASTRLTELAAQFVQSGGTHLIIDEIHKYPQWATELKLIYDYHPQLQVVFTGSSILDLKKGSSDLSRRAVLYTMQGLSFREYLYVFKGLEFPVYTLEQLLLHQVDFSKLPLPLVDFGQYLKQGYYPFAQEPDFEMRLWQVINQTLEVDIPTYAQMNVSTGRKLKQLLAVVAQSVPFKPNMSKMAELLGISRNNIADYLLYLEEAGMLAQLRSHTQGVRALGKVDKVYLDNTNLSTVITADQANIGNQRETFFLNQTRVLYQPTSSHFVDFAIAAYHFELGGKNKGQKQLANQANAFVVKDHIEQGYLNVIPLWHFGFLY